METRTQSSISKSKGARFSPTATSCQFDQLYLSQNFGMTISEAGKKIRLHSFVLTSCSSAMSGCAVWWRCSKGRPVEVLGPAVLVVLYNPGYESSCMFIWFSSFLIHSQLPSGIANLFFFFLFYLVLVSFCCLQSQRLLPKSFKSRINFRPQLQFPANILNADKSWMCWNVVLNVI